MILLGNISTLAKRTMCRASLYSFCHGKFSVDLNGPIFDLFWDRFTCNHSYGYAHNDILGRIGQTDSLTDFINMLPIVCIPMKYPG